MKKNEFNFRKVQLTSALESGSLGDELRELGACDERDVLFLEKLRSTIVIRSSGTVRSRSWMVAWVNGKRISALAITAGIVALVAFYMVPHTPQTEAKTILERAYRSFNAATGTFVAHNTVENETFVDGTGTIQYVDVFSRTTGTDEVQELREVIREKGKTLSISVYANHILITYYPASKSVVVSNITQTQADSLLSSAFLEMDKSFERSIHSPSSELSYLGRMILGDRWVDVIQHNPGNQYSLSGHKISDSTRFYIDASSGRVIKIENIVKTQSGRDYLQSSSVYRHSLVAYSSNLFELHVPQSTRIGRLQASGQSKPSVQPISFEDATREYFSSVPILPGGTNGLLLRTLADITSASKSRILSLIYTRQPAAPILAIQVSSAGNQNEGSVGLPHPIYIHIDGHSVRGVYSEAQYTQELSFGFSKYWITLTGTWLSKEQFIKAANSLTIVGHNKRLLRNLASELNQSSSRFRY